MLRHVHLYVQHLDGTLRTDDEISDLRASTVLDLTTSGRSPNGMLTIGYS